MTTGIGQYWYSALVLLWSRGVKSATWETIFSIIIRLKIKAKDFGQSGIQCVAEGRGRKIWKECVNHDMKLLGLQSEWATFRDTWRDIFKIKANDDDNAMQSPLIPSFWNYLIDIVRKKSRQKIWTKNHIQNRATSNAEHLTSSLDSRWPLGYQTLRGIFLQTFPVRSFPDSRPSPPATYVRERFETWCLTLCSVRRKQQKSMMYPS